MKHLHRLCLLLWLFVAAILFWDSPLIWRIAFLLLLVAVYKTGYWAGLSHVRALLRKL